MRSSNDVPSPGHFHAVKFYQDDTALAGIVAAFLAEGFYRGDPGIVIATPDHADAIERCLSERGVDVPALLRDGDLTVFDARDALASFMADDLPNASAFRYSIGTMFKQICEKRPPCTLRAYGEMVDLLWKGGLEAAAIRVETLWNELANTHDFKLLCGYCMGNFYKGAAMEDIKAQHSHQTSATGEHVPLH